LLSGVSQDLLDEFRRPRGVVFDVHQVFEGRVGGAEPAQEEVRKTDDRGQKVIKIVSDSARKLANSLKLLALHRLFVDDRGRACFDRRDDQVSIVRRGKNRDADALVERSLENSLDFHRPRSSEAACGKGRDLFPNSLR
jgi:hypothetical protein